MKDSNKYKVYRAFTAVGRWVLFAVVAFLILFPVLWIFISSITPPGELFKMPIDYIPDHPTLDSYKFLIEKCGTFGKNRKYRFDCRNYHCGKYCLMCHGSIWILQI